MCFNNTLADCTRNLSSSLERRFLESNESLPYDSYGNQSSRPEMWSHVARILLGEVHRETKLIFIK